MGWAWPNAIVHPPASIPSTECSRGFRDRPTSEGSSCEKRGDWRLLEDVKWKGEHEAYGSWIGITCIALGLALPSLGAKASRVKEDIHARPQALGPLASHMEINRPFASCPPIVFNPPSIDRPEQNEQLESASHIQAEVDGNGTFGVVAEGRLDNYCW